jgi:hypothetical protein
MGTTTTKNEERTTRTFSNAARSSLQPHAAAMAPKLAKGMDPLGDISDEDELSDSGDEGGAGGGAGGAGEGPAAPPVTKTRDVDFETLQRAGYRRCVFGCACVHFQP